MNVQVNGLLGLIVLILDVWAIVNVFQSSTATNGKVVWTVVILIFPVIGFLAWLLAGPKSTR